MAKLKSAYVGKFQDFLRAYLVDYELTVADIATAMNVTVMAVNDWISGRREPMVKSVYKFCDVFKVSITTILDDSVTVGDVCAQKSVALSALIEQYKSASRADPFRALYYVGLVGAAVQHFFLSQALPCSLSVTCGSSTMVTIDDPSIPWRFEIKGAAEHRLVMQAFRIEDSMPMDPQRRWTYINEVELMHFVKTLKSIKLALQSKS